MDVEAHTSMSLISMFLGRISGDLRIHVLLMSNNTHVETVIQATHLEDLFHHVLCFARPDDKPRPAHGHSHPGHHHTLQNKGLSGRKSVVHHLEAFAHGELDNDETDLPRPSQKFFSKDRKMTNGPPVSQARLSMTEAATWERLSELIQVDRRHLEDDDNFAGRVFSVQVVGWQRPDERKAVEQREVRSDFADIFHKTQQDMKRNRWVQE